MFSHVQCTSVYLHPVMLWYVFTGLVRIRLCLYMLWYVFTGPCSRQNPYVGKNSKWKLLATVSFNPCKKHTRTYFQRCDNDPTLETVTTPRQKCIAVFPPHPQDEKALVRLWYGFGKLSGLPKHRIDREGFGTALANSVVYQNTELIEKALVRPVSYNHLTLPMIYSV